MEYVHPVSVYNYIQKHSGAITESTVCSFVRHILRGLAFLHGQNIMHRYVQICIHLYFICCYGFLLDLCSSPCGCEFGFLLELSRLPLKKFKGKKNCQMILLVVCTSALNITLLCTWIYYYRNIKGANMLIDVNVVVKLADFGMAKHVSASLQS
jgi:serine/threonine protein kinase